MALLEFGKWKDLTIIQTLFQYYMTDINNYDNIIILCMNFTFSMSRQIALFERPAPSGLL